MSSELAELEISFRKGIKAINIHNYCRLNFAILSLPKYQVVYQQLYRSSSMEFTVTASL